MPDDCHLVSIHHVSDIYSIFPFFFCPSSTCCTIRLNVKQLYHAAISRIQCSAGNSESNNHIYNQLGMVAILSHQ